MCGPFGQQQRRRLWKCFRNVSQVYSLNSNHLFSEVMHLNQKLKEVTLYKSLKFWWRFCGSWKLSGWHRNLLNQTLKGNLTLLTRKAFTKLRLRWQKLGEIKTLWLCIFGVQVKSERWKWGYELKPLLSLLGLVVITDLKSLVMMPTQKPLILLLVLKWC